MEKGRRDANFVEPKEEIGSEYQKEREDGQERFL